MADAGAGAGQQPPMPDMSNMWRMMIIMILIFGLYFIDGSDHIIGGALKVTVCPHCSRDLHSGKKVKKSRR